MSLVFEPIHLDKQKEYSDYFSMCLQKTSEYSFVNLWAWAEEYRLTWAWSDKLVWIKQMVPQELYWAPVGLWQEADWRKCFDEHCAPNTTFSRIPETLLQFWKDRFGHLITIEESRGDWDYIYSAMELIQLKGKRFHKKKNLLNQFKNNYDFEYVPFGKDMVHNAMQMQEDWCVWRDCESSEMLAAENRAISRILSKWEYLQVLTGAAIMVDQKMVAYTIGERFTEDTLVIHFEKGNQDYKGVYQAINQMFLEHSGNKFEWVNREQDLDNQGLRKAKLSYNPVDFLKKYRVILNGA